MAGGISKTQGPGYPDSDSGPGEGGESEDCDSESELGEGDEFEECLLDVSNVIICLYNTLIAITNPAPRDRLEKCSSIDVSYFHHSDIDHVYNKFPFAEDFLKERLGRANSKRRQLLRYYEKHHERIVGRPRPAEQTFDAAGVLENLTVADTTAQTTATVSKFLDYTAARDTEQAEVAAGGSAAEIGTSVDEEVLLPFDSGRGMAMEFDARSVTSYASTIGDPDRLRVPPPDHDRALEGTPFECPYCFALVKIEGWQSWK